jgi:hypothetical protein
MNANSDNWYLLNAVECWLHYFPSHEWTPKYVELRDTLQQSIQDSNPTEVEEERTQPTTSRPQRKTKAETPEE